MDCWRSRLLVGPEIGKEIVSKLIVSFVFDRNLFKSNGISFKYTRTSKTLNLEPPKPRDTFQHQTEIFKLRNFEITKERNPVTLKSWNFDS
jgi:hypothetical protein